eukprot:c11442_g1_i1.p1 GENE.c11442_g1_i1~~c11442_g1_i1.p1  ORF type:complete len:372 (-),score=99.70 c11442_g1_i1:496-1611(-)
MFQAQHVLPGTSRKALAHRGSPTNLVNYSQFFTNAQGLYIYTRQWFPQGAPIGIVYFLHGAGEYCEMYEFIATRLTKEGFAVFALDVQGHGRSEGERSHVERFNHYINDIIQYMALLFQGRFHSYSRDQMVRLPKFVVGHSMGGLLTVLVCQAISILCGTAPESSIAISRISVASRAAAMGVGSVDDVNLNAGASSASGTDVSEVWKASASSWRGAVMSGPALIIDPKTAGPVLVKIGQILSNWIPKCPVVSVDPKLMSNSAKVVEAYANDPLMYNGNVGARWASEFMDAVNEAIALAVSFNWSFLILQATNDRVCLPQGAKEFFAASPSTDKTLTELHGMQHAIFLEPLLHDDENPVEAMSQWLVAHTKA